MSGKKAKSSPKKAPSKKKAKAPAKALKKLVAKGTKAAKKALAKVAKPAKPAKIVAPPKAAEPVKGKGKLKGAAPAAPVAKGKGGKPLTHIPHQAGSPRAVATKEAAPVSGPPVCREVACELIATTGGYCRMHYIKNWKKIKRKEMILRERKLNHYIEELVSKYPDKYIEAIRQDLASEKDFAKVIADLEIEEGLDDFESVETESAEGIIDNIKRDFEDEGDVF